MVTPEQILPDIQAALAEAERRHGVRVLYAVESGSRAWGFPSADSDFDVRFVYVHRPEWYLSVNVESKRDVIDQPVTEILDVSGWDLRKALRLFAKSNPPLLEWLDSPTVYADTLGFAARLRTLVPAYFSPVKSIYHYLHMARGNYREYLKGDEVWTKKYFYVLRPLLASRWIEQGRGAVPMAFDRLLAAIDDQPALRAVIDDLVARKKAGTELKKGPRIEALHGFADAELERLQAAAGDAAGAEEGGYGPLDELFREFVALGA